MLKSLGGSQITPIRRYVMYCFALRYWLCPLPVHSALVARERVWHSRALAIPHHSINAEIVRLMLGSRCSLQRLSDVAYINSFTDADCGATVDRC